MINEITIQNYKSIREINLKLGTINVFIGENGAGKSNILEAIALAGAAHADKLDNEFLAARGVRMTSSNHMRSAFSSASLDSPIVLSVSIDEDQSWTVNLTHDNKPYSSWQRGIEYGPSSSNGGQLIRLIEAYFKYTEDKDARKAFLDDIKSQIDKSAQDSASSKDKDSSNITISLSLETTMDFNFSVTNDKQLSSFLIFSPEDSTLRAFEREGQIEPLGTRGEGLFKLLKVMSETEVDCFDLVQDNLELLGWFDRLTIGSDNNRDSMDISDIYLSKDVGLLDQRSANEGFLFLAFYFALFSSSLTPNFFAIDNIDASLNPRLCRELIKRLCKLAKQKGKQVILTSHNPAILDGLDLKDDQQRLFVIYRDDNGATKSRRIENKPVDDDGKRLKLSEVFVRGLIGGLPKGF